MNEIMTPQKARIIKRKSELTKVEKVQLSSAIKVMRKSCFEIACTGGLNHVEAEALLNYLMKENIQYLAEACGCPVN